MHGTSYRPTDLSLLKGFSKRLSLEIFHIFHGISSYLALAILVLAGPSQAGGGNGEALALPVFGQTVNPISTRGEDYAHHSNSSPPGLSDLATALSHGLSHQIFSLVTHIV